MAARPAGTNPPALKIKLKRRDPPPVPNLITGGQPLNTGPKQAEQPPPVFDRQKTAETPSEQDGKSGFLDGESSRTGTLKRKISSPLPSSFPKRPVREQSPPSPIPLSASGEPLEIFPGRSQQLSKDPLVIKQRVGQPHISVTALVQRDQALQLRIRLEDDGKMKSSCLALENISHGQLLIISVVPSDQAYSTGPSSPGKQDETNQADVVLGAPTDGAINQQLSPWILPRSQSRYFMRHDKAVIPKHAGWFAWDHVHKLERQGLPQFFFGKSRLQSPKLYLDARNAIIRSYRRNPQHFLNQADVRGLEGFDDRDLDKILHFLSHWGLINYEAEPDLDKDAQKPDAKFAAFMEEDKLGQLQLLPLPLEHLESLHRFDMLRFPSNSNFSPDSVAVNSCHSTSLADVVVTEAHMPLKGSGSGFKCSVCTANCSQWRYCCEKQADFVLCPDCYGDGKFGVSMTASDFRISDGRSETFDSSEGLDWTDQETFMLLEALEIYGENWAEVSEFVGSKSKAQCIQHFIGLSIDDRFLEDMEIPKGFTIKEQGLEPSSDTSRSHHFEEKHIGDVKTSERLVRGTVNQDSGVQEVTALWEGEPVVFAEAGNPVMALVAFLAATVGPRVAAAAAHTALLSLSESEQATRSGSGRAMADFNTRYQDSSAGGQMVHANFGSMASGGEASSMANDAGENGANILQFLNRQHEGKGGLPSEAMKRASASALAAAAVKARLLADLEEREIQRLTAFVIDNQLRKLDMKLKQLEEIDPALEKECEQIERNRQRLSTERARFVGTRLGSTALSSQMPVSTATTLIRPSGPVAGSAVPATILATHSSGMLRPTLFTIGPGGIAMPVSASTVKPPPP